MYDVYLSFDTADGAEAARTIMGRPWPIPARGTLSRRPEERVFRASRIDRIDDIDLGIVEQHSLAERMPWQALFDASMAVRDGRAPPPGPSASTSSSSLRGRQSPPPSAVRRGGSSWRAADYSPRRRDASSPARASPPRDRQAPASSSTASAGPPLPSRFGDYARIIERDGQVYINLEDVLGGRAAVSRDDSPPRAPRRSLADRLSDPDESRNGKGKQRQRRRRAYEPYDPTPGPSRRRGPSPPPPPSAGLSARA